jgi:hypothetical protein
MYVALMQCTRTVRLHHNAVVQERLEAMVKEIRNERRSTEQKNASPPTTTERPVLATELVSARTSIPCTPNAGPGSTSQRIRAFLERASSPRLAFPQPGHACALAEDQDAEAREAAAKAEDEERTAEAVHLPTKVISPPEIPQPARSSPLSQTPKVLAASPHLPHPDTQMKETPLPPSQMPGIAPARQANNGSIKGGYVRSMAGIGVTFREVHGLWQVSAIKPGFHEVRRRTSSCVRVGALSAYSCVLQLLHEVLAPGDTILAIQGAECKGLTEREVVSLIVGPVGSQCELTIAKTRAGGTGNVELACLMRRLNAQGPSRG